MTGLADLHGKVAVVTGGASGIGKGIAQYMLSQGMQVVISDIDKDALNTTAKELGVEGVVTDVSRAVDVQALADRVVDRYGTVHLAVNNAGVGPMGRIADLTVADWRWMIDVNLFGVIHGISAFLPVLKANADGGHIVNTSSMAGLIANANMGAYTASKFAIVGITEVLAAELAEDGARVGATVLCPGTVHSNIKDSLRHRPDGETGGLFDVDTTAPGEFMAAMRWIDPLDCGALVADAVRNGDLYAITNPELWPHVAERHARIQTAFSPDGEAVGRVS